MRPHKQQGVFIFMVYTLTNPQRQVEEQDNPLPEWSESALKVLKERYLIRRDDGTQETPDEMLWRVANAVAEAEHKYAWRSSDPTLVQNYIAKEFHWMMANKYFMPNSPTLMNAGKGNNLQLSACFVLPIEDSIEGIFETVQQAAIIHQSGGGTGFSFSRLRPAGSPVKSTSGVASGPVSFLRVFNAATEAIKQGGTRRGANMGILRIDHPDIIDWIHCKDDGSITNFNISVAITDEFMDALRNDRQYTLTDPHTKLITKRLYAREVWKELTESAWKTGDPGIVFIDRANDSKSNPTPDIELLEATNPCGEQWLGPYDACNLGSINLGAILSAEGDVLELMDRVVRLATRFLDDVIDINPYPLDEITQKVRSNRRIGLGVMGFADALAHEGLAYDSEEARSFGSMIMERVSNVSFDESRLLSETRNVFPNFNQSIYRDGPGLRNAARTTVAPTGTISIIADCSSGIEPYFALGYQHRTNGRELVFIVPEFLKYLDAHMFPQERDEIIEHVKKYGTVDTLPYPELARIFVTAQNIVFEDHVKMQAAFQEYSDNSISKTINMLNSATVEEVDKAYRLAYDSGCRGVTVFRDGCKGEGGQVLTIGTSDAQSEVSIAANVLDVLNSSIAGLSLGATVQTGTPTIDLNFITPPPRPVDARIGITFRIPAPEGTVHVTVNDDEVGPFEVFVVVGKAGSDIQAMAEAIGRMVSLHLQAFTTITARRTGLDAIVTQLTGIGGSMSRGFGPNQVLSLPDAVSQALVKYQQYQEDAGSRRVAPVVHNKVETVLLNTLTFGGLCPSCKNYSLRREEGCKKCTCGYSEC